MCSLCSEGQGQHLVFHILVISCCQLDQARITWRESPNWGTAQFRSPMAMSVGNCLNFWMMRRAQLIVGGTCTKLMVLGRIRNLQREEVSKLHSSMVSAPGLCFDSCPDFPQRWIVIWSVGSPSCFWSHTRKQTGMPCSWWLPSPPWWGNFP